MATPLSLLHHSCKTVLAALLRSSNYDAIVAQQNVAVLAIPASLQLSLLSMNREFLRWIAAHVGMMSHPARHFDDLVWGCLNSVIILRVDVARRFVRASDDWLASRGVPTFECFHLAAVYALREDVLTIWRRASPTARSTIRAMAATHSDPILSFWVDVCTGRRRRYRYCFRAFLWAIDHDYVDAFSYFRTLVCSCARLEARRCFICQSAFELAVRCGHSEIARILVATPSRVLDDAMIRDILACNTSARTSALAAAVDSGSAETLSFLVQEATPVQLKLMIYATFWQSVSLGRMDLVELFLGKWKVAKINQGLFHMAFLAALFTGVSFIRAWNSAAWFRLIAICLLLLAFCSLCTVISSTGSTAFNLLLHEPTVAVTVVLFGLVFIMVAIINRNIRFRLTT